MGFGKSGWAGSNATLKVASTHRLHADTASTSEFVDGKTIGDGVEYAAWKSLIIGMEDDFVTLSLNALSVDDLKDEGVVCQRKGNHANVAKGSVSAGFRQ